MSIRPDRKTPSKANDTGKAPDPDDRPVASLDPACAGKHSITVTLAGEEDAKGDDRSSAASVRTG